MLAQTHIVRFSRIFTNQRKELLDALNQTGLVLVGNVDPSSSDSLISVANMLGTSNVGIAEELLGPRIMDIRVDPSKVEASGQPAYFNADEFPLHTDVSYVEKPPKFMLLHCVHPDPNDGGKSIVADCTAAAKLLSPVEIGELELERFIFHYPPGCPVGKSAAYAIHKHGVWRFKHSSMTYPEHAGNSIAKFYAALKSVSVTLMLAPGDLLIADNYRIAHGRTAFDASSPVQPARHFRRIYMNPALADE